MLDMTYHYDLTIVRRKKNRFNLILKMKKKRVYFLSIIIMNI